MPNTTKALEKLSTSEKQVALQILKDLKSGEEVSWKELMFADFKEIPVDIETFINDTKYLGRALMGEDGKSTVFPYWVKVLKDIFPDPFTVKYNTVIFTGGIGLGKSTIADIGNAYQLYKVLCLKDPYSYYGLQKIDTITISFLNNTIENAKAVAWKKFHRMLMMSDWFVQNGVINKMKKEPEWEPFENSTIELLAGSGANHIIGRAVFGCLEGSTLILTDKGSFPIKDLVSQPIKVYNVSDDGNLNLSETCTVLPTVVSNEQYEIELEDGTIIKCTPEHRFMLKDGTYKEAKDLTNEDELADFNVL